MRKCGFVFGFTAIVAALILSFSVGIGNAAAKSQSFNISVDASDNEIISKFAQKLKQEMENRSKGEIIAKVYTNGTLGGDAEALQSCADGSIAFVLSTTAPQVNMMHELAMFDLPNLYTNIGEFRALFDNKTFMTKLSSIYTKNGFHLLGIADSGFRVMTSNKKVTELSNMKGIKIRTMQNANHIAIWKSYGANPTPMAFGEVYIGLQQGTIDAQENPIEVAVAGKFYEQQKYMILTNHLPHAIVCLMSGMAYDKLPKDLQKVVDDSGKIATKYTRELSDEQNKEQTNFVKKHGMQVIELPASVHHDMRKAASPIYDSIKNQVGSETISLLLKTVGK